MLERFCRGVQSALVDAATTTIAGHLKTLLEQRGIETVTVGRTWGTVGVDKRFDVAFDCVGGEVGRRVAREVHLGDVPAALREYQPREGKLLIRIGH